jgi:hypothetical protein
MTPTPEIHVGNKSFIAQQFSFSIFWGNPRCKRTEQIKAATADARKKRRWLLYLFSRAYVTILQQFKGDPPRIARELKMIAIRKSTYSDARHRPANFQSLSSAAP